MRVASTVALVVVGVALLVGGGWWCLRSPGDPPDGRARRESTAPRLPIESRNPSEADALTLSEAKRTNESPSTPPRELPITWAEGVVTLREEVERVPPRSPNERPTPPVTRDVDAARLNGSFVPDWIDGPDDDPEFDAERVPESDPRRVRVANGRFRVDTHGATVMLVKALVLDERPAAVEGGVELSGEEPAKVEAHWVESVFLHVVDATTHEELRDVTVVGRPNSSDLLPGIVRRTEIAAERRDSPFHLKRGNTIDRVLLVSPVWIGAPGHAWRRVQLDFSPRATQTVELEAGARLVVTVKGLDDAPSPTSLRHPPRLLLRDPGGRSKWVDEVRRDFVARYGPERDPTLELPHDFTLFDTLAQDEPTEFDGLPTGEFVASLEVGDESAPHLVLCSADVTLAAGATARATLAIPPRALVEAVPVGGTLYVPPSWGEPCYFDLSLAPDGISGATKSDRCIVPMSAMAPLAGKSGWFSWHAGPVLPGTYRIDVERAGFRTRIEVGATGNDDVVLMLPDAARLVVRVVDETTKQPVRLTWMWWRPVVDGREVSSGFQDLAFDDAADAFVGSVASGSGLFTGDSPRYTLSDSTIATTYTVRPADGAIVLEAHARCGIELHVGGAASRILGDSGAAQVEWKCLDREHSSGSMTWGVHHARLALLHADDTNDQYRIAVPAPGSYRFSFPDYPAIAPFDVDVPEGEFVKYTVGER